MKKKVAFVITAFIILLPSCKMVNQAESTSDASLSEAPPIITAAPDIYEDQEVHEAEPVVSENPEINDAESPSPEQSDSSESDLKPEPPDLSYTPALRVLGTLGIGVQVVAELSDDIWREPESQYLYLLTDETVFDMLISIVRGDVYDELTESLGLFYYPELRAGEAISLTDVRKQCIIMNGICKIAYTNCEGEYEATIIMYDDTTPVLVPINPMPLETLCDAYYYYPQAAEFHEKLISGVFSDYIPAGFCVSAGSLGDINADGIEDALLCLSTGGYRAAAYSGVMPLFLLLGQQEGGYIIEQRISGVLFTPYRSSSYVIANNGYIDVGYDVVDGAARHYTHIGRFRYDAERNDWLLKEISYQPTFDHSGVTIPAFVRAPPHILDLPLGCYNNNAFYSNPAEWSSFDAVVSFGVPSYGVYSSIYTLAININKTAGYYEGYIYYYYESLEIGGFIQTIRGGYNVGSELEITVDESEEAFIVLGDVWKMSWYDEYSFVKQIVQSNVERCAVEVIGW